jgi:hypothetical protein
MTPEAPDVHPGLWRVKMRIIFAGCMVIFGQAYEKYEAI